MFIGGVFKLLPVCVMYKSILSIQNDPDSWGVLISESTTDASALTSIISKQLLDLLRTIHRFHNSISEAKTSDCSKFT